MVDTEFITGLLTDFSALICMYVYAQFNMESTEMRSQQKITGKLYLIINYEAVQ